MDIAILTEQKLLSPNVNDVLASQVIHEDSLLLDALIGLGYDARRVAWSDKSVNWNNVTCAIIRSTWNYFDRFDEFSDWLLEVKDKTILFNSEEIISWNSNKIYLADLKERGVNIVPSIFLEKGNTISLTSIYDDLSCDIAVVKPCISAGGRNTHKVSYKGISKFNKIFEKLSLSNAMMVQPFQKTIIDRGEMSLIVIDGQYTHAVQKIAKEGEFKVQDDYGGSVLSYSPTQNEIDFAELVIQKCGYKPLYARVDMIKDNNGDNALMELELIEPELFFRFNNTAAVKLCESIVSNL